jgi:hypothetical protein
MDSIRIGAVMIFILSVMLITGCAKSPESTVESFYRAVEKGEITEARGYVSSQLVGMLGDAKFSAGLAQQTEAISKCGGFKSIDVKLHGKGEIRQGEAIVTYAGHCPQRSEKVKLIKEDGKWKITADK